MTSKYSFDDHPEHRARLAEHAQAWIRNAMCTDPADQPAARAAIAGLYRAADLTPPPPERGIFVRSPFAVHIAGGVAAGVWWLRKNPNRHVELFGRVLAESELMSAISPACAVAVTAGMAELTEMTYATADATDAATYAATYAATAAATSDATRAATTAATSSATRAATYAATDAATSDATYAATYAATAAATSDATYAATSDATYAAMAAATSDATRAATYAATSAATRAATSAATDAATADATAAATADATAAATRAATREDRLVRFLLGCVQRAWRMHNGGSDWSAWPAYLSFFDRVAGLDLPEYERWRHYEQAALSAASRIMHEEFWIASDRHNAVHVDQDNRLHCETGPARSWSDGWVIWAWHGTRVPRSLIEDGWSTDRILREPNAEIRRCAIERIGWDRFVTEARLTQVGETVPDPGNPGQELKLYDVPERIYGDADVRVLLCTNGTVERDGTRRRFGLTVPADIDDPVAAAAWTYDLPVDLYATAARRA